MSVVFSSFNASPQTSEGGVSCIDGSPVTNITEYSPVDLRDATEFPQPSSFGQVKAPPSFPLHSTAADIARSAIWTNDHAEKAQETLDPFVQDFRNPFMTTAYSKQNATGSPSCVRPLKLSPEASSFTPSETPVTCSFPTGLGLLTARSVPDIVESPFCPSDPFTPSAQAFKRTDSEDSLSSGPLDPIGSGRPSKVFTPTRSDPPFTSDLDANARPPYSRYLAILGMPQTEAFDPRIRAALSKEGGFPAYVDIVIKIFDDEERVDTFMAFDDLRDADEAQRMALKISLGWTACLITQSQYLRATAGQPHSTSAQVASSPYDGQVLIHALVTAQDHSYRAPVPFNAVRLFAENFGSVMTMKRMHEDMTTVIYRLEYFKVSDARQAVQCSNDSKAGIVRGTLILRINDYQPQSMKLPSSAFDSVFDSGRQRTNNLSESRYNHGLETALERLDIGQRTPARRSIANSCRPGLKISPTGRTYVPDADSPSSIGSPFRYKQSPLACSFPGSLAVQQLQESRRFSDVPVPYSCREPGIFGQERNQYARNSQSWSVSPAPSMAVSRLGGRRQDFASSPHNVVDVTRIRQGLDVRTTIMLRNIPNKIDLEMLRTIVNETSFGKYDFMYLRIDFQNNCNVGYAFINFEDAAFIIEFVEAVAGQKWNRFNSDKVAEVSYATIQGKDCLIQKFRNSSVMCESPPFRPKLFYTLHHPLVQSGVVECGSEEDFPGPDNHSKLQRSIDNAEQIGLFAPREGQQFRDEQRRRRSQFDRGTPYADAEDNYDGWMSTAHSDFKPGSVDLYGRRMSNFPLRDSNFFSLPHMGSRQTTNYSSFPAGLDSSFSLRQRFDSVAFETPARRPSGYDRTWI